jgi:hypothetical protein
MLFTTFPVFDAKRGGAATKPVFTLFVKGLLYEQMASKT